MRHIKQRLVGVFIVALLLGLVAATNSVPQAAPPPSSPSTVQQAPSIELVHRIRTRTRVHAGIHRGPYITVRLSRARSYSAMRLWRRGHWTKAASVICIVVAARSPLAGGACELSVLRKDADIRNAFRGVRANHHRVLQYTQYSHFALDLLFGNWKAPLYNSRRWY